MTLTAEKRIPGKLAAPSVANGSVGVNWEGIAGFRSGTQASIADTNLLDSDGVTQRLVVSIGTATPQSVNDIRVRVPDGFTAWGTGIRLKYALVTAGAPGANSVITLAVKDATGATVASQTVTVLGDLTQTQLQDDLVVDMSASGIGAGDDMEMTLTATHVGGTVTVYLGELFLDWS